MDWVLPWQVEGSFGKGAPDVNGEDFAIGQLMRQNEIL